MSTTRTTARFPAGSLLLALALYALLAWPGLAGDLDGTAPMRMRA